MANKKTIDEFVRSNPFDIVYPDGSYKEDTAAEAESKAAPNVDIGQIYLDAMSARSRQERASRVNDHTAALMAYIKKESIPTTDLAQEFSRQQTMSKMDPDYKAQQQEAAGYVNGDYTMSFENVLKNTLVDPLAAKPDLQGVGASLARQEDLLKDASIEELFVESMSMTDDEKKYAEQVFQVSALKDISDLMQDQSFIDKVSNYAGMLFLSDTGIDMARVVDSNLFDSGMKMEEFINKFQTLPAGVKMRLWPDIKETINKATDKNNIKTAAALMQLLNPHGGAEMHTEATVSNIFLGVDIGTLGAALATKMAKLIKAGNMVKNLQAVEATEEAAKLNAAAGLDKTGTIAKAAGIDAETSAVNASPFRMEDIMPEATSGINVETQSLLREIELGNQETSARLNRVLDDSIKDGLLYEREKDRVQQKVLKAMDDYRQEVYSQHGWAVEDVKISQSTESGFTLEYKTAGVPTTKRIEYKLNDVGEMEGVVGEMPEAGITSVITSPSFKLAKTDAELVNSATRIELRRAKILDAFTNEVNAIANKYLGNPLTNRKSYKKVDDVLLAGDDFENAVGDYGKVFSLEELTNGVRLRNDKIVKLTEKEAMAYYRMRSLFDNAWVMKNQSVRQALKLNGVKEVHFEGVKTLAKDYDSAGTAIRGLEEHGVHEIWDPTANSGRGAIVRVSQINAEDLYDKGYKIVRFHKGSQDFGHQFAKDKYITHAIVKNTDIGELPLKVIHYKKGYVPRIDKHGYYFVKEPIKGSLDGAGGKVVGMRTLRIFDNKKQAEMYAKELKGANPDVDYSILHDRQMAQAELADEALGLSGGLYTSPRSSHPILFGSDGIPRPRLSAYQSLQRNLQHLSNLIPRNEWRIGVQQRWLNTAYHMFEQTKTGLQRGEGFNAAIRGESHTKEWRALEESRKYINDQLRVPTDGEKIFADVLRNSVAWAEGKPLLGAKALQPIRNSIMSFSQKDPFALARSATFHALLGWFNPVQLLVQSQGFSVAFGLYPEHWAKAVRYYPAIRALIHASEATEEVIKGQAKTWSKITGLSEADLVETLTLWKKSGLQESIRSTADHAAAVQEYGFARDAFRNLADKGLVFYREGEFVTRAYAMATAREAWRKTNPKAILDAKGEKEILDLAMRLQLNLTRANRASWQKGALSIPTQFLQIQTKFIETLAGHSFTPMEKAKLLGVQFGLYGGAGVVGGTMFLNSVAEQMGVRPEDMDPELKRWARGGLLDMLAYTIFHADVDIGKRGAITSGLEQTLTDMFLKGTPLIESMAGAFGAGVGRTAQAFQRIKPLVMTSATGDLDLTMDDYKYMANEFAKVISSWRNVDKAMFLHRTGMAVTGKGNVIVDDSLHQTFNSAEIIMQAMGLQLSEIEDVYSLQQWERNEKLHLDQRVDALTSLYYNYASRDVGDSASLARSTELVKEFLLKDLNHSQRLYVQDKLHGRITRGEDARTKVIKQLFRDTAIDLNNSFSSLPISNTAIPNIQEK